MPVPLTVLDLNANQSSNFPQDTDLTGATVASLPRNISAILKRTISQGSDITAGDTLILPSPDERVYQVVGNNATISAISTTNAYAGRVVTLRFTGTNTLIKHSTSLVLPNKVNLNVSSGDILTFVYTNAVWVCASAQSQDRPDMSNNLILYNGDFDLAQYGSGIALGGSGYFADGWRVFNNATTHACMFYQSTIASFGYPISGVSPSYSSYFLVNATKVFNPTEYAAIAQPIEGYYCNSILTSEFTISCWIQSSKTGTMSVFVHDSASNNSFVQELDVSPTFTYFSFKVPAMPLTATRSSTNGIGCIVGFTFGAGNSARTSVDSKTRNSGWQLGGFVAGGAQSNFYDTNATTIAITGVRVNLGATAPPYSPVDIVTTRKRAHRYYINRANRDSSFIGQVTSGINYWTHYNFPEQMRATPTIQLTNATSSAFTVTGITPTITNTGFIEQRTANAASTQGFFSSTYIADANL